MPIKRSLALLAAATHRCPSCLTIAALVLASISSIRAATLISDPFADGSRSNTSGGDVQGAVWYQSVTATGAVTIENEALKLVPTADFHKLLAFFPSTTLTAPGDTLRVTFDYSFPTAPASAGGGFRVALANSAGTKQSTDTGGSTRSDDKNYGFDTNPGQTGNTSTGVRREDAGDDILGGGGLGIRTILGTSGGAVASGTTTHTALLQIIRLTNGDLSVLAQIDNLTPARGTEAAASVLTYSFDEFAFGFGGTGYRPTISVDNVVVTSTSTAVLNITATDPTASKAGLDPATFTVTRSGTTGALNVPYTLSGTATNGAHYQALSGTVSFTDGESAATITVTPLADYMLDESKTVIVTLSEPAGTILQTSIATATIEDTIAVWAGQVEPEFSELYTFYLTANDGARLWIDDRLLVARTFFQTGAVCGQVRLSAGHRVNLRMESSDQAGPAGIQLEWSSASRPRQIVPASRLHATRVEKAGGSILKEHWSNLTGTSIGTLTALANYPNKPSGRELLTSFECLAQDWADSYGTRVTGYIVPPVSGSYTFAVSGNDTVSLYLSTDATPANKTLIASVSSATAFRQWNAQPSQQSVTITLAQDQRYYVELLHKEDSGSDHWSCAWMKPGDSAFSVIPGSALVQAGLDRAQPATANLLDTLAQDHPRIFATPERFAWLRGVWQSSTPSAPKTWAQSAITSANAILAQAPVAYAPDNRNTILDESRLAKERLYILGLAWWLTGDNAYAERAWTELNTVADNSSFPDWGPQHFLDTAEMTHACAIGYDWFYHYWTQARRDIIRTAIITKGLTPGLAEYTNNVGWQRPIGNNWNPVCNGGLSIGALAVGAESESLVTDILNRALNSLRPVMPRFTTDDGNWYEGPGYWTYTIEYNTRHLAGLEWVLGSDFGLSNTRMFSETGFYPQAMTGPGGIAFNHSDSGSGRITEDALQWHARRFNQPLYAWYENTYGSGVLSALWWNDQPTSPTAAKLTPDFGFHGEAGTGFKPVEVVTMRTNWSDSRATYLGSKGGWMGADHGNMDAGDFVLDALGKRWFLELGGDDYALPGYFNSSPNASATDRWDYYRNRAEGQNTLVVDPGAGPDMLYNTVAPLLAYQSEAAGRRALAIYALTPTTGGITRQWRGFQLMGSRNQVLVQDEVVASTGRPVWWFAHYSATATTVVIDPDGTSAMLTQGAERLWVKILSSSGTFQILDATPLPTSPNPEGQNANTNFKKLTIHLPSVTNTTLAVWMVPLATGENPPTELPAITPLNTWNLATVNDAPLTPNSTAITTADQAIDIDLRNYATDDQTDPSALLFAVSAPLNGTLSLLGDGHTARFTPTLGYTGIASFSYTATDEGGLASTGTISLLSATSSQTWIAAGTSSTLPWSSGGNWSTAAAPLSSRGATLQFFTGQTLDTGTVTSNNDLGNFTLNILTLAGTSSGTANAAVTGGTLTLNNNGLTNPIVNLSATLGAGFAYDINTPVTLAAPTTFQGTGSSAFRFNGALSGAGALIKSGSSTLILNGASNATGGATITAGTLQVGNNSATGSLPSGTITNNGGTLRFHRSDTALNVPNTISGTGGLQFGVSSGGTTTAITTLSGASNFAGNVTINSGGVRIAHSNAFGTGAKTITLSNGTTGNVHLRLDGTAGDIDLPSTFTFVTSNNNVTNGTILNEAGNNIIRGNFTLTGGGGDTRFHAVGGTLTLTGNLAPNTTGRNLVLAGAASGTITGTISDGISPNILSSINKSDAGTWTLNGAVSHTGTIAVNAGTLVINNTVSGPSTITVAASARLGGSGSIATNTTINGTHQPGDGIGIQTFTGTLGYGSASHLAWELLTNTDGGAGTAFDGVVANGVTVTTNAAVDIILNRSGSTVNFTDIFWSQNHTWPVLSASTLTGAFKIGTVSADSAGRSVTGFGAFTLQHTATSVSLIWTPAAPMQQWQAAKFGSNWNNASIAGDTADPDRDGRTNLLEYALATDPMAFAAAGSPASGLASNHLSLTFTRNTSGSDLTLTVSGADALSGWTPLARSTAGNPFVPLIGGVTVIETGSGPTKNVQVIDLHTTTDPAHPRRFLQLHVQH